MDYHPLFSDAGVDPPQFWIFAPGLTITAIFVLMLVSENFFEAADWKFDSAKRLKTKILQTTHVLKY